MPISLPTIDEFDAAAAIVREVVPPTPQYAWPLLAEHTGASLWLKHENHTPTGAFKVRGGLVYFAGLAQREPHWRGVISATRGNHGQSVALAARRHGLAAVIVVPRGNSVEKNAAMRALGAELIEHGADFQEAREHAGHLARERGLHMVPSFHRDLMLGVGTYGIELLRAVPDLEVVYVPIGLGSGICGMIAAREALGRDVEIVGVVSAHAPAYALSFEARSAVEHAVTTELADGLACRATEPAALELVLAHVSRIVRVTDQAIANAIAMLWRDTHNLAEGAGAAGLAAVLQDADQLRGRRVATVVTGGNIDLGMFAREVVK